MRNKIKSFKYAISVMALAFPALVSAALNDGLDATGLASGSIYDIVENIMTWILGIVGFVAIIGFCIAGIMYLTAAGDEDRQKSAKSAMVYSIIGVIVALGGYVIWQAAQTMLGGGTGTDATSF